MRKGIVNIKKLMNKINKVAFEQIDVLYSVCTPSLKITYRTIIIQNERYLKKRKKKDREELLETIKYRDCQRETKHSGRRTPPSTTNKESP